MVHLGLGEQSEKGQVKVFALKRAEEGFDLLFVSPKDAEPSSFRVYWLAYHYPGLEEEIITDKEKVPECTKKSTGVIADFEGSIQKCEAGEWKPLTKDVDTGLANCDQLLSKYTFLPSSVYKFGTGTRHCDKDIFGGGWTKIFETKMAFKAEIDIMPLKELLDPQGKAVAASMKNLNLEQITDVRIGKHITLHIDVKSQKEATAMVDAACSKLLANPIMEKFTYEIAEVTEVT